MQRVLITGATGFVGKWMLRCLRRTRPDAELWAVSDVPLPSGDSLFDEYRQLDIRDGQAVQALVAECRPAHVCHLAGLVGAASLADHLAVNAVGSANLYDALADAQLDPTPRIVQIGSAAAYGPVQPAELPITEEQPLRPITPYAVSKVAQDYVASSAVHSLGLHIVQARVFNIMGPGQPHSLVPMTFIRQFADVRQGKSDRIRVGLTSPRRDFTDIRDITAALNLLLDLGCSGDVYNIGSGADISIQEVIDRLMLLNNGPVRVEVDSRRVKSPAVHCVRADITKLTSATGWKPEFSWQESLKAMWLEVFPS